MSNILSAPWKNKQNTVLCALLLILILHSLPNSLEAQTSDIVITKDDTFTDPRDNQNYRIRTFQRDDIGLGISISQTWMIDNLNYKIDNSWFFDNSKRKWGEYGRLYNWEAAQSACPTGWHLPSDIEWQRLLHILSTSRLVNLNLEAFSKSSTLSGSEFEVQLGGILGFDGIFAEIGEQGGCWSATEFGRTKAYASIFGYSIGLPRSILHKEFGLSVRCIKNNNGADPPKARPR